MQLIEQVYDRLQVPLQSIRVPAVADPVFNPSTKMSDQVHETATTTGDQFTIIDRNYRIITKIIRFQNETNVTSSALSSSVVQSCV